MVEEKITKKQLIPMIVGVLTMVLLIFGATYAYFSVTAGNTSGTTTITGDIGGDTLGTVTLSGGNTELYLGISAYDMSESKKGTVYYSSSTEGSRETSVNNAGKTTYTATLSGDETDEVMYACDYVFTVTSSGTALRKTATKDIKLVFNGDINRTINLTGTDKISGTWYGFKKSNAERKFNAYLQLTNTEEEQNSLAGTNLSVEIENTKWKCYLSELDELVGEAYALYTEGDSTLTFVRSETPYNVGDTYNGVEIIEVYTGFEGTGSSLLWSIPSNRISNIIFKDEIRPISTSSWFAGLGQFASVETFDITKLNVSRVTDMSYMFDGLLVEENINIDLSDWDVSNVTGMSGMFMSATINTDIGLSDWDVSNVTDMSQMFTFATINTDIGLSDWNVSNVTSMEMMFYEAGINENIDLSGWDVSNVLNYYDFSYGIYGIGTLTPPIWND